MRKYLLSFFSLVLLVSCGGGGGGFGGGLIPGFHSFSTNALIPNAAVDLNDYLDGTTGPYDLTIISGPGTINGGGTIVATGGANFDVIIVGVTDSTGKFIKVRIPVIGNPVNWYQAKSITTTPITQWPDSSSNTDHASCINCPVLSDTTINEHKAISFDGIDDQFSFQSSATRDDATYFVLFRTEQGGSLGDNWFEKMGVLSNYDGAGGHFDFGISINDDGKIISGYRHVGGTTNLTSVQDYRDDKGHLLVIRRNQALGSVEQFIDTVLTDSATGISSILSDNPNVHYAIASHNDGSNFFQGDLSEIIIYGQNILDSERDLVSRYLKDKYNFTVDASIVPNITIDTVPADPTNNNLQFGYTAMPSAYFDIEKIECRITGQNWIDCSDKRVTDYFGMSSIAETINYNNVNDGSYTFEVRVIDSDGRTASDSYSSIVDTSAPVCSISYPLDGSYIPLANPIATFSCSDISAIVAIKCDINDAEAWNDCTTATTQTFSGLTTDDVTKLEVKAQDQYGLWSTVVETTWITDLEAPICSFTTAPSGIQTDANESFIYACSDNNPFPGNVECSVDGGPFVSCGSNTNFDLAGLSAGGHSLTIRVTDVAGVIETQVASWTTDLTGPVCTFSGQPNDGGYDNNTDPTISFDCVDDNVITNNVQCNFDGTGASDCTTNTSQDLTALLEGSHNINIAVSDIAGNATNTTLNWSVDLTNPSCSFTIEESGEVNSPLAHFEYNCGDPTSGGVSSGIDKVECSFDGGAYTDCDGHSMHDFIGLPDGPHSLRVQPIDLAGNIGDYIEATWITAALPPTISSNFADATFPSSIFLELIPSKISTMYYCISSVSCCDPVFSGILYVTPIETVGANGTYCISYYGIDTTTQESPQYSQNFVISRFDYLETRNGGILPVNGNNHLELSGGLRSYGFFRDGGELGETVKTGDIYDEVIDTRLKWGFDNITN